MHHSLQSLKSHPQLSVMESPTMHLLCMCIVLKKFQDHQGTLCHSARQGAMVSLGAMVSQCQGFLPP